jgi:cytochrome c-type biogenesis protein CcmH/NrfF
MLANSTILAILAVGPPAGDKGNHTAFLIITPLLIVFLLGVIIWAITRRRRMRYQSSNNPSRGTEQPKRPCQPTTRSTSRRDDSIEAT